MEKKSQVESILRRQDLESIILSPAEMCMYSKAEKKWIQKNYRVLRKRLGHQQHKNIDVSSKATEVFPPQIELDDGKFTLISNL